MEKQESKSKWDDLARELGAEVSPEIEKREEAVSHAAHEITPPPAVRAREKKDSAAPSLPKRSKPGWDSLATDLGLPTSEPNIPPAPIQSETAREELRPAPSAPRDQEREPEREETQGRRPQRPERPPRREKERQERPRRLEQERQDRPERQEQDQSERQDRERRPRREQSQHRRSERGGRGQRDNRGPRRDERGFDADVERERGHEQDVAQTHDVEASAAEPETPREQPQKPAAVSLWHKIFGSPAEPASKAAEEAGPEAVAPSDFRDEPRSAGSGFADAHPDEPIQFQEETENLDRPDGSSPTSDDEADSERKRGRSRRRGRGRGRGRGRDAEDRPRDSRPAVRRDAGPRPEKPRQEIGDEDEDAFGDDLLMDHDDDAEETLADGGLDAEGENGAAVGPGGSRSASALQRAIPSWDEAIGFIVDSNMQSRSQRRPPSRPGSRDSSPRGRSRGRRRS